MGFSTAVASVIIFATFLFFATTIANSLIETGHETRRAEDAKRARTIAEQQSDLDALSGVKQGGTLRLEYENTGSTVLHVDKTALFIDGSWVSRDDITYNVDGKTTNLWAPGETLHLETPWPGTTPSRAWLVIETGRSSLWEF